VTESLTNSKQASVRLEELEKKRRKETVKEAHATIIQAEKLGLKTEPLREAVLEVNNWDRIQAVTKDLKAEVELEAVKAQVKADIKQDLSQALHQTAAASPTDEDTSSTLSTSGSSSTPIQ
jgi:long-subunit acyl-CoA synthetase (AMP-forming)